MRRHTFDLLTPRTKTAWDKAAGKDTGAELNEEAGRHFARVDHCYRVILGRVATALVAKLSDELDEVLADYAAFKRAAAVLDFDDLLERARTLVREPRRGASRARAALSSHLRRRVPGHRPDPGGNPVPHRRRRQPAAMAGQRSPRRRSVHGRRPQAGDLSLPRRRRRLLRARRAAPSRGAGRTTSFRSRRTSAHGRRS